MEPISSHKEMAPVGFAGNAPSDVYQAAFKRLNEAVSKVESSNSTKRKDFISVLDGWSSILEDNRGLHGEMSLKLVDFDLDLDIDMLE